MKTIEEAGKEFAESGIWQCPTSFEYGIKFAQRWIPIEEELPEEDTYVLTLSNRHNGDVYYRVIWFRYGGFYSTEQTSDITHWRPIELN